MYHSLRHGIAQTRQGMKPTEAGKGDRDDSLPANSGHVSAPCTNRLRFALCDLAYFLLHSCGPVVFGAGVGRADQPVAVDPDALAQGAAFDDRIVDDREYEGRSGTQSQRARGYGLQTHTSCIKNIHLIRRS